LFTNIQYISVSPKKAKEMEYDRHILNSTNSMKTSWNLINIELGKGTKNQIIVTKYWW